MAAGVCKGKSPVILWKDVFCFRKIEIVQTGLSYLIFYPMFIENNLYQQIRNVMPIPCVDLIVVNNGGDVLLAKRTNEPAQGEWWFPGGRVHYLENRVDAAMRKLKEECGLETDQLVELGTFDVIVGRSDNSEKSHAITTLFFASVNRNERIKLDSQNSEAEWRLPQEWMKLDLNPFIQQGLAVYNKFLGKSTT